MCDEKIVDDWNKHLGQSGDLTRRQFGAVSVGAGLAMFWSRTAGAVDVTSADIEVSTPDGVADCHFVHPSSGRHPGVLIWPDALGLRPAFKQMGKRLAESGYSVLVVNQYYRAQKAPIAAEGASFADEAVRNKIRPLMGTLNAETHVTDAKAFVGFLDGQDAVDPQPKGGHDGLLHGRSDHHANSGRPARPHRRRRFVPRGRTRERCSGQPPSAGTSNEGALSVCRCAER